VAQLLEPALILHLKPRKQRNVASLLSSPFCSEALSLKYGVSSLSTGERLGDGKKITAHHARVIAQPGRRWRSHSCQAEIVGSHPCKAGSGWQQRAAHSGPKDDVHLDVHHMHSLGIPSHAGQALEVNVEGLSP
jgi:hypothetical protein